MAAAVLVSIAARGGASRALLNLGPAPLDLSRHAASADDAGGDGGHEDGAFLSLYRRWQSVCGQPGQNSVLNRGDGINTNMPERRPWSVHARTFGSPAARRGARRQPCASVADILAAVADGQRAWVGGEDGVEDAEDDEGDALDLVALAARTTARTANDSIAHELRPSYFVPRGCDDVGEYLGAEAACAILDRFAFVGFYGDSFGRHATNALLMILGGDWALGGYPRAAGKSAALMDGCRCDGQFSANPVCREYDWGRLLPTDIRDHGYCTHLPRSPTVRLAYALAPNATFYEALCRNDSRPTLVFLNGGAHFDSDANRTMREHIDVFQAEIERTKAECPHPLDVTVVWTGLHAQSRRLDPLRPHQQRERTAAFNAVVDRYVAEKYGMLPLNFWNLSRDVASTDGLHHVTDVNLYKANAMLHVARLLGLERQGGRRLRSRR